MISARKLLKRSGVSIFIVLLLVGLLKDFCLVPVMGKVWGWTLGTTPEGFISNSNVMQTLVQCPWILLIGFVLVLLYVLFALWEAIAAIIGVAYAYEGQNIKMADLFRISGKRILKAALPGNWMILVYAAVILPLSNMYQVSEMIGAFIVPEYIEDFINSKTWLWGIDLLLVVLVAYVALRWLYVLPAFVLKKQSFSEVEKESRSLTKKGWLKNGIKLSVYQFLETIRLGIIPFILIVISCVSCLYATGQLEYSLDFMANIGFSLGYRLVSSLVGRLVYISVICYLVAGYRKKLNDAGIEIDFDLPELTRQSGQHRSVVYAEIWVGLGIALLIAVLYFPIVHLAEENIPMFGSLFGKTEIIAHKGYSSRAPENTMPAFELADRSSNTDYIELDVWSAKDGIPVVLHNMTVTDATGLPGRVDAYTSDELRQIPAPYRKSAESFPDAYIPTLEEVLAAYANTTPILIEIKGYRQDENLPDKIVALMDKYDCKYTCMIHSQDYEALRAVKLIDPDIRCGLIMALVSGQYYDLPYADFYSVEHTFLTQSMVNQLHMRGKKIYVWTVNHSDTAEELRLLAVDGIITDYPDAVVKQTPDTIQDLYSLTMDVMSRFREVRESTFEDGEF